MILLPITDYLRISHFERQTTAAKIIPETIEWPKNKFIKLEDDLRLKMYKRGTKGRVIIYRTLVNICNDPNTITNCYLRASNKFS